MAAMAAELPEGLPVAVEVRSPGDVRVEGADDALATFHVCMTGEVKRRYVGRRE